MTSSSYISDSSDYVSSVMTDTPFPSLTKSQKLKILQSIRQEQVSTFTEQIEPNIDVKPINETLTDKNSCCCLC